jgi:cysteinyl-tRNA synthetase, unknown class
MYPTGIFAKILLRSTFFLLSACLLILSCVKDEEKLPEINDSSLSKVNFWAYQLEGLEEPAAIDAICSSHYDLIVMDQQRSILGSEDYDTRSDVLRIKQSLNSLGERKIVLSYIDVGQAERYRYYWQDGWNEGNPSWILEPDPDGWDDSYSVKFWDPQWKAIMKEYIGRIIDDGFDGIYLDWLAIYEVPKVLVAAASEKKDSRTELVNFIGELSSFARGKNKDFVFIAQNAPELGSFPGYLSVFNAIAQEDIWFDGSGDPDGGGNEGDMSVDPLDSQYCLEQLKIWQQNQKPVFNVEYALVEENVAIAYNNGNANHYITYTTNRLLDKLTHSPPPGY